MTTPAESAGPVPPTVPSVKRRPTMDRVVTRIAQVWVLVGVVVLIAGFVLVEIDAKSGPGIGYMLALVVCPFTLGLRPRSGVNGDVARLRGGRC